MEERSDTYPVVRHVHEEEEVQHGLVIALLGGILIFNSFLAGWVFPSRPEISGLSALVGALLLTFPIIRESLKGFYEGELHMVQLASIAVLASIALGDYKTAGVVAFIILVGHLLEHRTALGAREAIESLLRLTPPTAHLLTPEGEKEVKVEELKPGDLIRVKPGENIPADGIIRKESTTINEASITGESLPVDKGPGDTVYQGTTNLTGAIVVEVTRVGEDTTLGKVKQLILQAEQTKIPIISIIEKYFHWYIPVIIMLAGLILFFTREANRAIAALIVGAPCALLLATPTAIIAALSSAARMGIMIKDTLKIELASLVNAVIFDKTGTLTTGELAVTRLHPLEEISPDRFLFYTASVEKHSQHPTAKALRDLARKAKVKLAEPEEFMEKGGKGVKGKVEGREILVGRDTWLEENGIKVPESVKTGSALSVLHVGIDGRYYGWIELEDQMRMEAKETTEILRKLGIRKMVMLTGDRKEVAEKVARESGFEEVVAECLPETKLDIVEKLKREGYTLAVIGDGINDAPALAAGDVGIALGAMGSDVAINSASIALMSNDLRRVPFLLALSRTSRRVIYQNIALGGIFVIIGLLLAGGGWLSPIVAALYHEIGSLVVIFNSARIIKFEL